MNKQLKTVFKIFGSEIFLKVALGFTSILIARKLEPLDYADFFFFITITNLCINIPSSFFNKLLFTDENKPLIDKFDNFTILTYLSSIALISLLLILVVTPFNSLFLFIFSVFIIVVRVIYLYNQTILQSKLNFKKLYLRELIRVLFYSLPSVIYLFLASSVQIEIIILILFLSFLLTEIINKFKIRLSLSFKKLLNFNGICFNKKNKYIILFTISFLVLTTIDTLMLKSLSNNVELSNFGAAFTLYSFLMLGLSSIHKYILPKTSMSKVSEFQAILSPIFKLGYFFIPCFLVGIFFSESVFELIYGYNKYPKAYLLFNILSLSAIFSFFFSPYSNLLNKMGIFKFQFKLIILGLVLMILLNYIFIPDYGALAVVIVNLIVYSIINFSFFLKAKQIIKPNYVS